MDRAEPGDRQTATASPGTVVYVLAIALLCWLVVPWWVLLGTTPGGELVFGVCVAFSVIGFGIAVLCVLRERRTRKPGPGGEHQEDRPSAAPARLHVWTGELPMRDAVLQILLVPASVALAFTLLAAVDLIDRL